MCDISFRVVVNPFKHTMIIQATKGAMEYTVVSGYESLDERVVLEVFDKVFDLHFYYEAEALIEIHPVEENKVDFDTVLPCELIIKLTD